MATDLLGVGAFSRASSISIKTLRTYHEMGLLVPATVDPRTGYRSYAVDQLADALVIVRLRGLDVPLVTVKEILDARDPDLTRRRLADHETSMHQRLLETERIVAELRDGLAPVTNTPVHLRREPGQHTLCVRATVEGADLWDWLWRSRARLREVMAATGATGIGPFGALYGPDLVDDEAEQVDAFIPIDEPVVIPPGMGDVAIGEVPAGPVAVLVHLGPFDGIGDTYRSLGAWVGRQSEPDPGRRIIERYVVGPIDTDDPAGYRTEISWPVRRR